MEGWFGSHSFLAVAEFTRIQFVATSSKTGESATTKEPVALVGFAGRDAPSFPIIPRHTQFDKKSDRISISWALVV